MNWHLLFPVIELSDVYRSIFMFISIVLCSYKSGIEKSNSPTFMLVLMRVWILIEKHDGFECKLLTHDIKT